MIADDYIFLAPDWYNGVKIKRAWRNNVLFSLDRSEQRSLLVSYPERSLAFMLMPMSASENNYVKRKLYRAKDKVFGVPWWCDRTETTALVNPGSGTTVSVGSTDYRNFDVGGLCVLIQDENNYEVKEIVSITSTTITVDSAFLGTWQTPTDVYPVLQGRLITTTNDLKYETSYISQPLLVEVKESFDGDVTRRTFSGSSYSSYNGSAVFNRKPNWVGGLTQSVEVFPNITQYLSKEYSYAFQSEGRIANKATHLFESREDIYNVVKFFDECKGRYEDFWYPTWTDDVVITAPFTNTDTTITIEDIEWDSYYKYNDAYGRFVLIVLPDGTEVIRKVISAPTSTSLQLDSAIGYTVTSTYGVMCTFLVFGRFSTDDIEVTYVTEEVAESELKFTSILRSGVYTTTTTV